MGWTGLILEVFVPPNRKSPTACRLQNKPQVKVPLCAFLQLSKEGGARTHHFTYGGSQKGHMYRENTSDHTTFMKQAATHRTNRCMGFGFPGNRHAKYAEKRKRSAELTFTANDFFSLHAVCCPVLGCCWPALTSVSCMNNKHVRPTSLNSNCRCCC